MELKAHIKDKLKAKQLKKKVEEPIQLSESETESETESEPEEIVIKKSKRHTVAKVANTRLNKQLPNGRQPLYSSQEYPAVRFV